MKDLGTLSLYDQYQLKRKKIIYKWYRYTVAIVGAASILALLIQLD